LTFRESYLTVNDDIELPRASGLDDHRTTSTRLKPSLHTEGFGFVVSDSAIKDEDRHIIVLVGCYSEWIPASLAEKAHLERCFFQHASPHL
jgi:hypothetical protein